MKVLKLIIVSYDSTEMYLIIKNNQQFEEAKKIIQKAERKWLESDELQEDYGDFCEYYEYLLEEAKIEFEYINADEEMELL